MNERSHKKRFREMYAYLVALILYHRRRVPVLPLMWLIHLIFAAPEVWFQARHILLTALIMAYDPLWDAALLISAT